MKILVIGGAGYIGSHVTHELLKKGYKCGIYDNLSSGKRENVFPETRFYEGDILDYDALVRAMSDGWDAAFHLAAFKAAGESMIKPEKYALNNLSGTINILNAMCETGIRYMVFSSSAAIYGSPEYLPVDEAHPKNPENFYGFTKLEIERFLDWYDRLKNIKYAALRYFNAAGYDPDGIVTGRETNPANLLPVIMEVAAGIRDKLQIFGDDYETRDGTGVRDYVHVTDLAAAHIRALEYITEKGNSLIVNLGSEQGISVKEMLEAAREITSRPIPAVVVARRPGDPAKLVASSQHAEQLLTWKALHSSIDELIATTWHVYKKTL